MLISTALVARSAKEMARSQSLRKTPARHALFFYKGMGFFFDAVVVNEASRWVEELMSALALDQHVEVYVGPPDPLIHGTQSSGASRAADRER